MQEFWAIAYVHQHSIRFKLDNKKYIVNLETFRDMLHICPRIPGQSFDELPFEKEILEFLSRNIDYAFLIWEDFMYQVEHKNQKKSNEMYYPRFTKVIIHHFMSKDLSIPRRNRVNWHYVRDDIILSTIKVVSRHQNTQQYGAVLPIELMNEEIRNSKAYKEYYACATGEAAPKPKASARRKRSGLDTFVTPPTAITTPTTTGAIIPRLTAAAKGKQLAKSPSDPSELARTEAQQLKIVLRRSRQETHISQHGGSGTDEGTGSKPGVLNVPSGDSEEEISWNSSDDEDVDAQEKNRDDDEGDEKGESDDEKEDDDDESANDDDDDGEEEVAKTDEQDDAERGGDDDEETESDEESNGDETREEESFDPIPRTSKDSEDDGNGEEDQGLRISEEEMIHEEEEADELYRIVHQYMNQQMNEAVRVAVQIQTDRLRDSYQRENDEFLRTIDDNMKRIIKEQVKSQVKEQVSKILQRIEQSGPESASAPLEPATRSAGRSTTGSKSRQASASESAFAEEPVQTTSQIKEPSLSVFETGAEDQPIVQSSQHPEWFSQPKKPPTPDQRVILKRRRDDDDDQGEGPSTGSDWGSKRQREGKGPESASAPLEPATRSAGRSTTGSKSRQASASESAFAEEPVQTTSQIKEPSLSVFETGAEDQPIVQSSQHPEWFSQPKKPPTPDRDWNKTLLAAQGSTQS
nr:hypothetical protein [Tanacetum cinerariifolium]